MNFCVNCEKNDGNCYTSNPPKYKCTIDNSFHNGIDGCDLYDRGYQQRKVDAEKDDLIKACINQLRESDADEIKVSADTKDGYKITVIVELKE